MLNLNLISKEDKDAFRFMAYRRAVLRLGSMGGVVLAVFLVLLIPSFLFLNVQRKEILRELAAEENALRAFGVAEAELRIALLNEKIAHIRSDAARERGVSDIMETLAPSGVGVRLAEMKLDFAGRGIALRGVAATRGALLAFERALAETGLVGEISVPLVDLVKLTNVSFTLAGVLK